MQFMSYSTSEQSLAAGSRRTAGHTVLIASIPFMNMNRELCMQRNIMCAFQAGS
jgi:hypothetical protein